MVSILQSILMGFGPFYFYPWKAPINHIAGDSYEVGYAHFRVGHRHPVNLGLHLACLLIQVAGNFSLLYAIDNAGWYPQPLPGIPILSALSAATWSAYLFTAPVNKALPLISSAVIFAGYTFAPRITPRFMDKFAASTFIAALLISNFAIAKKKALPLPQFLKGAAFMGIWYFGWPFLEAFVAQSAVGDYARQNKTTVMIGVAAYVFGLALTKNPLKKLVISSVALVRLASAAVGGDPILFFWSYAFSASLFQGITHSIVREEATLLSLEREEEAAKLRFEWAHVTHFPNLLLNAVVDAVFGADRKKTA